MRRLLLVLSVMMVVSVTASVGAEPEEPFHVMILNDDGVSAPGVAALAAVIAADPTYRVTVVAPAEQQSAMGQSLIIRGEVSVKRHEDVGGCTAWSVDATPATAARVGIGVVLAEDPPSLVLSGINKGENAGRIAWYSGTVGGAREAALMGITSVAFSMQKDWENPAYDFSSAAEWAKPLIDEIRMNGLPNGTYLNVNIPRDTNNIQGYRLTYMGLAKDQLNRFEVVREEDGVRYLKSRWFPPDADDPGTDNQALIDGWVTITPLTLDNTDYRAFPVLTDLALCPHPEAAVDSATARQE